MTKLLLSSLFLLVALFPSAQNYRPFYGSENQTFHYKLEDTGSTSFVHFRSRIDSVGTMGGDTAWFFPMLAHPITNFDAYFLDNENDLGAFMVERPGGAFEFHSLISGDTIFLRTQMPLNTAWPFRSTATITAEITARTWGTVFGTTTDSILEISLSDGKEIRLSQNYGMIEYPRLTTYYFNDPYQMLTMLEEARIPTIRDYYGWNLGDSLGVYEDYNTPILDTTIEYQSEVIFVSVSPDGNHLEFDLDQTTRFKTTSAPFVYGRDTIRVIINDSMLPELLMGTYEYLDQPANLVTVVGAEQPNASFQGQLSRTISLLERNFNLAEHTCLYEDYDTEFAYQLGKIRAESIGGTCGDPYNTAYDLVCYQVGNLSEYPCPDIGPPDTTVSADPYAEAGEMHIYPNPNAGTFQIKWENLASKGMTARLHDLNGRLVWEHDIRSGNSGSLQVKTEVAPGIYILSLREAGGALLRKKMVVQ